MVDRRSFLRGRWRDRRQEVCGSEIVATKRPVVKKATRIYWKWHAVALGVLAEPIIFAPLFYPETTLRVLKHFENITAGGGPGQLFAVTMVGVAAFFGAIFMWFLGVFSKIK